MKLCCITCTLILETILVHLIFGSKKLFTIIF